MTMIMRIALLGSALLGASSAANAETSGAVALSPEQMDAVTAGGLTLGGLPSAFSQATSGATGAFVITSSRTVALTSKSDPAGQPPVLDTYGTVSYGMAMAAHGGNPVMPASQDASVSTDNALPFANAIGGTVTGRYEGPNGVIESSASVYIGGAWISMVPPWVTNGL